MVSLSDIVLITSLHAAIQHVEEKNYPYDKCIKGIDITVITYSLSSISLLKLYG
jgi:hypothetical protein